MTRFVRRAGFVVSAITVIQVAGARVLAAQAQATARVTSDSLLRKLASSDPSGRELVDMTDQLVALAIDTNPSAATLTAFLHANGVLIASRNSLGEAQALFKRSSAVADREEGDGSTLLSAFRRARTPAERSAACRRIYYGVDPESFDITPQTCNERYAVGGPFDKRGQAHRAGLTLLKGQMTATSQKVLGLERSLETAQNTLDDALRGRTSYTAVLLVAAGLTFLMLVLLNFAHEDVRRLVFTNVHATELVTVVLVVLAVLFFGSIQALSGEAVSGLLGAIAGYVLGRQNVPRGSGAPDAPQPSASAPGAVT